MDDLGGKTENPKPHYFGKHPYVLGRGVETFHCTLLRTGTLTLLKQLNVAETLESDVVAYGASVREVINLWKVKQAIVLCPSQMSYSNCIKTCQKTTRN